MNLDELDTSNRCPATVVANRPLTAPDSEAEVRELVLELAAAGFEAVPGQSIGVIISGPHDLGHEEHFRVYTIADSETVGGKPRITIAVRRCAYIDEYSGERHEGIASNYLCDLPEGGQIEVSGPYGLPFEVPEDRSANLIMIGAGTGIAPFRAFVKHIYKDLGGWDGRIWLFFGAHTGLEHIYMNDHRDDFTRYYDEDTFEAFKAVSPRPHWADPIAWEYALEYRSEEILDLLAQPNTYVFVAGRESIRDDLDQVFSHLMGAEEAWRRRKAELTAGGRWVETVY